METIELVGNKFQYEKLMPKKFKNGVCAFKMVDEDGYTQYFVFTPESLAEQIDGKEIKTPNDGILVAACPDEERALMVASSIGVAAEIANVAADKMKSMKENVEEIAKGMGFDLEKLEAEVNALEAGGIVEAARTAEKSSAVGNAAAMREALCEIVLLNLKVGRTIRADVACGIIASKARAALSAPPRNCDIYKTSGEANRAITEYCSKMAETGECVKSCPYRESEGGCAFGWILAAAGTKGEGDGSK